MSPGLDYTVELDVPNSAPTVLVFDDPIRGKFNTGTFGAVFAFVDLADRCRGGRISRGVSRFSGVHGRPQTGVLTLTLDNSDGALDPSNLSGPYVSGGRTLLRPRRRIRVRMPPAAFGDDGSLFVGFVESWTPSWQVDGRDSIVTVVAYDGRSVLADFDGTEQSPAGADELSGARVNRVLDNAGWPADDRDIATGQTALQATTLAQPALTELQLVADTEFGDLFVSRSGDVTFRERDAFIRVAALGDPDASDTTRWSDERPSTSFTRPYRSVEIVFDAQQIANVAKVARVGGTEQIVTDAASVTEYRQATFTRSDLLHRTDAESADYAAFVVAVFGDGELRFDTLVQTFTHETSFEILNNGLMVDLGTKVVVKVTPPYGSPILRQAFVRGITHEWAQGAMPIWNTTWALQDAERFQFLVFDNSNVAVFDGPFARFAY